MKRSAFLASLLAVSALSACNKKPAPVIANEGVTLTQAAPPLGGSWTDVVNATPSGGYMMGNPNAKVKLIEIGSLSCPHCKAFEDEGVPRLLGKYVKSGSVSWEFRPYVIHGAIDMAANLIARCNGTKGFFPLAMAMYKNQPVWMAKIEATPHDKLTQIQNMPPNQAFIAMADALGLQNWAAPRGLPHAKSNHCLSDQKMIEQEVQSTASVTSDYPDFSGTPAFVVNGRMLPKEVTTFAQLDPELKSGLK